MTKQLVLPQKEGNEKNKKSRRENLDKMREAYAFQYSYRGAIATILKLPSWEQACLCYKIKGALNLVPLALNIPRLAWTYLTKVLLKRPFRTYGEYDFFAASPYPAPDFRADFLNDRYMGQQRVAGMNPTLLQGIGSAEALPAALRATLPANIDALIAAQRLYATDYAMLQPMVGRQGAGKFVAAPYVLYLLGEDGWLMPVAIQLDQTDPQAKIFTPGAGGDWVAAKTFAQAADGTHQELWTHATRIHYVLESIIMASHRQLGRDHPLFALLEPHLEFTLSVNVHPLFEKEANGTIPTFGKMFGCDYDSLIDFMAEGMRRFDFRAAALPEDLRRRKVENPLLCYPYRDDGLPIWQATESFVRAYLRHWYPAEGDVAGDPELQAWADELGRSRETQGLGIGGFPTAFASVEEMVPVFTHILFMATAHHSSVHYPQYTYAGLIPNMPFAAYAPPPSETQSYPWLAQRLGLLPPFGIALYQMFIFTFTNFRVNRIGEYEMSRFDPGSRDIIRKFREELRLISKNIKETNKRRPIIYKYMDPDNVPNSVSV